MISCRYLSSAISKEPSVENEKIKQPIKDSQTFGSNPKLRKAGCSTKISTEIKVCV
jgi:hypothetical protein